MTNHFLDDYVVALIHAGACGMSYFLSKYIYRNYNEEERKIMQLEEQPVYRPVELL